MKLRTMIFAGVATLGLPRGQGLVFRDVDRLSRHTRVQRSVGRAPDERDLSARKGFGGIRPDDERQGAVSGRIEDRGLAGKNDRPARRSIRAD